MKHCHPAALVTPASGELAVTIVKLGLAAGWGPAGPVGKLRGSGPGEALRFGQLKRSPCLALGSGAEEGAILIPQ